MRKISGNLKSRQGKRQTGSFGGREVRAPLRRKNIRKETKKMKKLLALILALAMVLALCACGSSAGSTASSGSKYDKIKLTMAVNGTDTQVDSRVANHFKELVEAETDGAITIEVYPNDQLAGGSSSKGVEMVADGSTDIAAYATVALSVLDPKLGIALVPWTFSSYTEARETIDATGLDFYNSVLNEYGLTAIGSFHNGFRQLSNNKHAVTTPEDLKNLKIRVPGGEIYMSFFREFGADPTNMNWGEVFTALQQGTIDGQENGVSVTSTSGVLEVQKYVTIWNYSYENDLVVFNSDLWNSLSADTQAMLTEKAVEACNWGRDIVEAEHDQLIEDFRAQGVQVDVLTDEQIDAFKSQVTDFCKGFYDKYGAEACAAFNIQ